MNVILPLVTAILGFLAGLAKPWVEARLGRQKEARDIRREVAKELLTTLDDWEHFVVFPREEHLTKPVRHLHNQMAYLPEGPARTAVDNALRAGLRCAYAVQKGTEEDKFKAKRELFDCIQLAKKELGPFLA
jgi:hypothetical protein